MGKAYTSTGVILNNTAGSVVVDSQGIVSQQGFSADGTSSVAVRTTTSGTAVDLANTSLTYINSRATRILAMAQADVYFDTMGTADTPIGVIKWSFDGTLTPQVGQFQGDRMEDGSGALTVSHTIGMSNQRIVSFNAGTHTIKLQYYRVSPGTTVVFGISNSSVNYVELGK